MIKILISAPFDTPLRGTQGERNKKFHFLRTEVKGSPRNDAQKKDNTRSHFFISQYNIHHHPRNEHRQSHVAI